MTDRTISDVFNERLLGDPGLRWLAPREVQKTLQTGHIYPLLRPLRPIKQVGPISAIPGPSSSAILMIGRILRGSHTMPCAFQIASYYKAVDQWPVTG